MRSSRKQQSEHTLNDCPSTSTMTGSVKQDEDARIELVARLMNQIRTNRDKREAQLRKHSAQFPNETSNDHINNQLLAMNNYVEDLERGTTGLLLEELLTNPKYGSPMPSRLSPVKSPSHNRSPGKPVNPIEIKVEEEITASTSTDSHSLLSVNTGENNVEKAAKQEAQIMARIAELRRSGLWTTSRLPLCVEPPRNKTHWDFLLEEVKWMANDFRQERIFKRNSARKLALAIHKQKKEELQEVEKTEARKIRDGKRICASIAKMVRDFWQNVDKVVDFRAQEILESKKRQAQAQHMAFIVGEANKLSSLVQEGLVQEKSSKSPSISSKMDQDDRDFFIQNGDDESDDESTIAKDEKALKNHDVASEVSALSKEANQDMDDLLASLPAEYLESLGLGPSSLPSSSKDVPNAEMEEEDDEDSDISDSIESEQQRSVSREEVKEESNDGPSSPKRKRLDESIAAESMNNDEKRDVHEKIDYAKLNSSNSEERQQELANIAEEALKFQPKGFTLETTQIKTEVPFLIRGTLREYQMVGLDWLVTLYEKNLNGILADEMGLGKTIQTISLLAHLACAESIWGPHLIIVPTSVILNWEMELKKWCPALKILTYFGSVTERKEKRKGWSKPNTFHVCITSYKTVTTDIRSFKQKAWQYMILDEAQNIKNFKSQRWQALLNVRARRRLLLTGTPLQNNLMELWSLMHFLMPAIFASHDDFKDWFSNPLTGMMEGSVEFNAPLVQQLHKVLRPFILRRLKSEVEKQLPEKTEHVIKCPLSKRQRFLYDDFMSKRSTKENLKSGNMMSVLNIVMQLRKCCNHPNLFEPRPVVSPFALSRITKYYPAAVFDLVGETSRDYSKPVIPECLRISKNFNGWCSDVKTSRPTIEELKSFEDSVPIPVVEGFNFQRPPLEKRGNYSSKSSPSVTVVDVSAAELQRAGFGQNETFLMVGEEDDVESLLKKNEGAPVPIRVRVDDGKIVLDSGDKVKESTDKVRLCQVVTVNGEKTLRDLKSNGAGISNSRDSHANQTQVANPVTREVYGKPKQQRVTPIHPFLKSNSTVLPQTPLTISTDHSGFHHTLAEGGTRDSIVNYNYQFSPPLKRRRVVDSPLISGDFTECVPDDVYGRLQEERDGRLMKLQSRFSSYPRPLYANELLHILRTEVRKNKESSEGWNWTGFEFEREDVREALHDELEQMMNRYVMYVSKVQVEAPLVAALSSGRSAMAKALQNQVSNKSRTFFNHQHPFIHKSLCERQLQFPELGLIEYDCGKLQILTNLLRELYLYKHRCLIFTQMSRMLDVLQAFLSYHGYQYFRLDGSTGIEQRQAMMERFNADPKIFCFILSTRSGGVGVNLTGADTVIFYDSDWNPTMDAQAQDRCHRIGQTRSVSIYRLISERTIEENILKKATQKRKLGEMAIDQAGFTPDFFKQSDSIRDLFESENVAEEIPAEITAPKDDKELEKIMASLEDEQDVVAAKKATAEAKADVAEFDDRSMPHVSLLSGGNEVQDDKYIELIEQLKPIERYAVNFLEAEYKPEFEEEVKEAEAMIGQKIDDWQKAHDKAMKEEEDTTDDFYGCGSLLDEILADCSSLDQFMPSWTPPTPPTSDTEYDVFHDDCLDLLYDPDFMGEARLPATIHELHRPLAKQPSPVKRSSQANNSHSTEQNVMKLLHSATNYRSSTPVQPTYIDDQSFAPFDFPDIKTEEPSTGSHAPRRDKRKNADQRSQRDLLRGVTPPRAVREELDYEGPEWNIIEDHALLEAVRNEDRMKHTIEKFRQPWDYNWEYIAGFVNRKTGFYRSPRQCSIRYQMAVRPREAGQLFAMDPITKKPRKINLTSAELTHLRKDRLTTDLQYEYDANRLMGTKIANRIKSLKSMMARDPKAFRRNMDNTQVHSLNGRLPPHQEARLTGWNLKRDMPEDIVSSYEEKHLQAESRKKIVVEKPTEDRTSNLASRAPIVNIRSPAIALGDGIVETRLPFILEIPSLEPVRPPPPPPPAQMMQAAPDHQISFPPMGRRMGSVPSAYTMQPGSQQNYVLVNPDGHPGPRRQEAGGQALPPAVYRSFSGPPARRTPPATPINNINRGPVSYGPGTSQSSSSFISNQSSGTYPSTSQTIQSGMQRPQQNRVMNRQPTTRMYVQPHIPDNNRYMMGTGNNVRMVSQPRHQQPGRRTVGMPMQTMVMPRQQMVRTVPRPPNMGGSQQRVMVVGNTTANMSNNTGNRSIMPNHSGASMTRQLLSTRGMGVQRGGSPQQTVAQVVLAPPSMQQQNPQQQQQQQQHSMQQQSQPPQLTPSVAIPSSSASSTSGTQHAPPPQQSSSGSAQSSQESLAPPPTSSSN